MKALVVTAPGKIECKQIDEPKPDGEKALIKVSYAGICGSDIGFWQRGDSAGACGHEFSGVVVDPGSSKTLKPGDRVTAMEITPCLTCDTCLRGDVNVCKMVMSDSPGITASGGMAESVLVRADMVRALPDKVDDVLGAMTEPAAVSMHAVRRAGIGKGSRVLILGAGPIGVFAAAVAQAFEAEHIVITETNENRLAFIKAMKYAHVELKADAPDFMDQLKANAGAKGFDVLLDCADDAGRNEIIQLLRPRGKYIGLAMHGELKVDRVPMGMNEYDIQGSFFFLPDDFDLALEMMNSGKLDIRKLCTKVADFSEAQACFEDLASGKSRDMKILFKP
jgi:2-desacetyl-2-hydroxyethyl bacteriochlorophyllide A dehydrogenase